MENEQVMCAVQGDITSCVGRPVGMFVGIASRVPRWLQGRESYGFPLFHEPRGDEMSIDEGQKVYLPILHITLPFINQGT